MTSSLADTSTNDVTSTDNHSMSSAPPMVITTEVIMRECVRLGLYRNPVCNDKLYLHGKGFDVVEATAFDPYTDVKVLWLEGNALGALACGAKYIQTKPPKRRDPFASASESETDDEVETDNVEGQETACHVDPMADVTSAATEKNKKKKKAKKSAAAALPDVATVKPEDKDIFSSLYPTVRHIYLHNNVFRVMPDLHRFERLNTVNLANNFFTSVEPGCPEWNAAHAAYVAQCDERRQLAQAVSKSATREREQRQQQQAHEHEREPATEASAPSAEMGEGNDAIAVVDPAVAAERRRHELDAYRRYADAAVHFCPHESIAFEEGGGDPKVIERHLLRTCSSVRTLNLAGNQIDVFEGFVGLLCYKALSSLDLSQNEIKDGEVLLLVLERMPNLLSLKLSGNPCVRTLARYRKRVLTACPKLMTLDDRPVFEEERRLVTAWAEGGEPAEAKERQKMKEEKEAAQQKRLDDFRALLAQHRGGAAGASGDAYRSAVSTPQALHRAAVRGDDDDDDSVTSSETTEDSTADRDARGVGHDHSRGNGGEETRLGNAAQGEGVIAPAVEENTVVARASGQRVLSSNSRSAAMTNPAQPHDDDDDMEDVYVP